MLTSAKFATMAAVTLFILLGEVILFFGVNAITANRITEIVQNNNIHDKSREFVNVIKEDLRRNNDDYLERLPKNTSNPYLDTTVLTTSTATTVAKVFNIKKFGSFQNDLINDKNRRALDVSMDNEDTKRTEFEKEITKTYPKRFTKVTKFLPVTKPLNNKILTKKHTKLNVDKLEKVKSFLEKNKVLLKDFISKKKMEILTQALKTTKGMELRVRAHEESIEEQTLPNDEQLDMAPAKGGRIHAMRIKGRLCQRNVLMPEGPKYDSKGNVYLGSFSAKPGQDYAKTVPPKIILPRCCNCCKKSVLGCE